MLHQSAERYLTTYLLVKNHYKPKEHDVLFLYEDIVEFDSFFE
jgi:HEPN domain-containing protein